MNFNKQRLFKILETTHDGEEVEFLGLIQYQMIDTQRVMSIQAASLSQFPYNDKLNNGHMVERNDDLERLEATEQEDVQHEMIDTVLRTIKLMKRDELKNPEIRLFGFKYKFPDEIKS